MKTNARFHFIAACIAFSIPASALTRRAPERGRLDAAKDAASFHGDAQREAGMQLQDGLSASLDADELPADLAAIKDGLASPATGGRSIEAARGLGVAHEAIRDGKAEDGLHALYYQGERRSADALELEVGADAGSSVDPMLRPAVAEARGIPAPAAPLARVSRSEPGPVFALKAASLTLVLAGLILSGGIFPASAAGLLTAAPILLPGAGGGALAGVLLGVVNGFALGAGAGYRLVMAKSHRRVGEATSNALVAGVAVALAGALLGAFLGAFYPAVAAVAFWGFAVGGGMQLYLGKRSSDYPMSSIGRAWLLGLVGAVGFVAAGAAYAGPAAMGLELAPFGHAFIAMAAVVVGTGFGVLLLGVVAALMGATTALGFFLYGLRVSAAKRRYEAARARYVDPPEQLRLEKAWERASENWLIFTVASGLLGVGLVIGLLSALPV